MKEIKFRIYCELFGKILYDGISYDNDKKDFFIENGGYSINELMNDEDEPSKCFVMQYTGIKDKNGKELYEGDVYTMGFQYEDGTHKYGDQNVINDIRDFDICDEFEIIGNIYEDFPELIK